MRCMALRNDCNVGCDGSSSCNTVDHLVATARPYQELKNSSDRRPVAHSNFPSSKLTADPHDPGDTIQDPVPIYDPGVHVIPQCPNLAVRWRC